MLLFRTGLVFLACGTPLRPCRCSITFDGVLCLFISGTPGASQAQDPFFLPFLTLEILTDFRTVVTQAWGLFVLFLI